MHATVRRYSDPGVAAQLKDRADEVLSILSGLPGFRAYYLIEAADETVSVSVYDDESSAQRSNEEAASWLRENMPGVAASGVSAGEVVLSG